MVNKSLRLAALTLVIGFIAVGSLEAQTDPRLNGRWVGTFEGMETELRLNNGVFEELSNGIPLSRGTFRTSNNTMTMNPTHLFGGTMNFILGYAILESRWLTINEFILGLRTGFRELGVPDVETNALIDYFISPPVSSYSVDATTLISVTTIGGERVEMIYHRR